MLWKQFERGRPRANDATSGGISGEAAARQAEKHMLERARHCHLWSSDAHVSGNSCECEDCARSKGELPGHAAARPPELQSKEFNEWVHVDLIGPISEPSFSGHRRLMSMIDDYTGVAESSP